MKPGKKYNFLGLVLLLSLLLAACGDNTATTVPAPAAAPTTAAMVMSPGTSMSAMTTAMTTSAAMTMAAMTTPATTTTTAAATMAAMTTAAPATTTAAAASAKVIEINIADFKYAPETITIPVGTKVIWTNKDSSAHTVTSDESGGPLKSPLFDQGKTFEYTFDKAGTYAYHCEPHPFMKGKIVVTA
ncbi:MAG: plastocyanin [Chloroflexi bacterium]|nr:plastocyanin [Chloroflexota bacterium]